VSFLRHREIYQVTVTCSVGRADNCSYLHAPRLDESPVGYSLVGLLSSRARLRFTNWRHCATGRGALQPASHGFLLTTLTRGLTLGAHRSPYLFAPYLFALCRP